MIPDDLFYAETHEYLNLQNDEGTVGITAHAVEQLGGEVTGLELPQVGASLQRGEPFGVVESIKAVSDVYMPVGGTVVATNTALLDDPENLTLLDGDPYGQGWLIRIRLADPTEVGSLLSAKVYRQAIKV